MSESEDFKQTQPVERSLGSTLAAGAAGGVAGEVAKQALAKLGSLKPKPKPDSKK